ncbi:HEAT repeat domain-containing protein [Sphingomonas edaphi]|uniref:HEAT repeat domain-containing protein n=1 Tax=Sphingomonas edaphi TaxID=2315689 RepID=A0A418PY66_9SPHN|nr:HEAT repeat domain-containing protein [Sphingomonas edaphi]RIX26997.1 HEAT repeat domain-containing protein [Sphingomonas edaphi]
MGLLDLWDISLALAALSLAIMTALVVGRFITERRRRNILEQRKLLMPLLLGGKKRTALTELAVPKWLLAALSVELVQLVRGDERAQIAAAATDAGAAAELQRQARRGSARKRASAVEALAYFHDDKSSETLALALSDKSPDVRLAAAMALAESGRAPAAERLMETLGLGVSENSMLIVSLFQKIAAYRPAEIRDLILLPTVPNSVKAAAIDALSASQDYGLVKTINELALRTDPSSEDLPRFLRALGAFSHPGGAPAVRHCLSAPTWWVRAAAAEAAGRIGMSDTAFKLGEMLSDPDWWVRFRAGEALVRLGSEGKTILSRISKGKAEPARSAARLTLAEQGIPA